MKVLVVGLGSIGRRHALNLQAMGHEVNGCDKRMWSIDKATDYCPFMSMQFLGDALHHYRPEAVLICTPPSEHLENVRRVLQAGVRRIFIEKPLAATYQDAIEIDRLLAATDFCVGIGYQFRALDSLKIFSAGIEFGKYAAPFAARAHFSAKNQGRKLEARSPSYETDILLEASHEIDYLCWLFGPPQSVWAPMVSSSLCEMVIQFELTDSILPVSLHLDDLCGGYRRGIIAYTKEHSHCWVFDSVENDSAYKTELEAFMAGTPLCKLEDGYLVMQVIDAARRSHDSGRRAIVV